MQNITKIATKNKFGQYFTPETVADFMIELADISTEAKILEPSCGEGVFLALLQKKGFFNITAFEIDNNLAQDYQNIKYESFVSANIEQQFDLIIGNPPYIRWKNLDDDLKKELSENRLWNQYFNSLCDYLYIFILKSIELLKENGQLIFICPEYWISTTHSLSLRNYMVKNGYFQRIFHFNETPIFEQVSTSTVIFKYIKAKENKQNINVAKFFANKKLTVEILEKLKRKTQDFDIEYFDIAQFKLNERWLIYSTETQKKVKELENNCLKKKSVLSIFDDEKQNIHLIGDFCDIGNGLVSGLDKAFQVNGSILNENEEKATLKVIKAKDLTAFFHGDITKYIFLPEGLDENNFATIYPHFYQHFQAYKVDLAKRYQYQKTIPYWEWAFLRNLNLFQKKEKRILVPCKERISHKKYFRFALAETDIFPTQDVTAIFKKEKTKESIYYILAYLNQDFVFEWLRCNGIIKGNIVEFSEKPIASIPFRAIDWENEQEIALYDEITSKAEKFLATKNEQYLTEIKTLFEQLFKIK